MQVARIHPWPNEVGVDWICRCPGIVWEPIRDWTHTQLVREQSPTVVLARWTTVDWTWHIECARANLDLKKKKKSAGGEWMVEHSSQILASVEKATRHHFQWICLFSINITSSFNSLFSALRFRQKILCLNLMNIGSDFYSVIWFLFCSVSVVFVDIMCISDITCTFDRAFWTELFAYVPI